MSDVKRYAAAGDGIVRTDEEGPLVLHSDYARLKAEVERLTEAHSDALADFWAIHKGYFDLKAEVERLRKAGDAMVDAFNLKYPVAGGLINAWNAAKEGKQS